MVPLALKLGSDVDMQWNHTQRAFVGIGLVLFQLTSEWNWLSGAPWQAADLDGNSETMSCASNEVSVKVVEEYAKRCCSFVLNKKIVTLLMTTFEYSRPAWGRAE
jgi:hypothetical protein